jgi:hypothetical protein
MNRSRSSGWHPWLRAMLLLTALALAGCASVRLAGDYDEQIDKGVTALQRDTEAFFVKLDAAPGDKAAPYRPNRAFYGAAKVAISSLRLRADATERNSLTVQMLDKLQGNFDRLQADHKEGITKVELPLYLGGLNSQFTAILTYELAKKRGQTPDAARAAAAAPATPFTATPGAPK